MKKKQTTADRFCAMTALLLAALVVFSAITAADANPVVAVNAAAQSSITGEWIAEFSRKNPDEVQFTIIRRGERRGQHTSSDGIPLTELQGLTREQAFGPRAEVNFRIVREAGTFQCEGFFKEGRGAGQWSLTINQNFVSAMRAHGYNNLSEDDLFTAAVVNVKAKTVDDLEAAGYDRLTWDEVVEASIFKVTAEFIREMKAAGFDNLTFKKLVEARIFDVDSKFVKEVEAMGFGRQPFD